jgi:hypothetical protein
MIAERLLVRPDIETIFEYRRQTLLKHFGGNTAAVGAAH